MLYDSFILLHASVQIVHLHLRINVYEISVSFPDMWKSQQETLGVKCDARWVIGPVCVNKGPRRSCVLYICTVFPG